MTNQTNEAAERSAHVTRGEKPAPAEWPVVRMPDGTWKLKSVVALEARIAKLEAALQDMSKHVWRGDWDKLKPETRALLPGGKDGST